jgi:NAD(P)-dependent dehydrogenase (short-subunit alcohol dehydrogenase family)
MKEKVVIITGATSGIGKALAFAFAKEGAKIVITGRNQEALNETTQELKNKNIEVLSIKADSSSEIDNQMLIQKTIETFGKIDILVNNAGISMRAMFEDLDLQVIKQVMDINFY